jgi:NADPH2:quinone reductase
MRALVVHNYGGPEVMKIEDIPTPQPGKNEVLIRIHAAGVNPVDTIIRAGHFPPDFLKIPFVLGSDGAGVVEAVGAGVTRFKLGERVFCFTVAQGCYAQYCVVPDHLCWPLPGKLTFSQGSALGVPYFTAYRALFQTGTAKNSKSVLVHGASGGVGLAVCQLARQAGMTVYGTAGTEEGLNLVKEAGAHHVFNHREANYTDKIMEATKGEGVELVVEMVAHINLPKDIALIKKHGIIAIVGSHGPVEIECERLFGKEGAIFGVFCLEMPKNELVEAGAAIARGVENGSLSPFVDKEYPMEKAGEAHKDIMENKGTKGKLVILIK